MKRILLAAVAALTLGSVQSALAADIPVRKAPPAAPAAVLFNWSGCYLGVSAGWGWGRDSLSSGGISEGEPRFDGWLAGGQIGCDWQFASTWVIGIEGMYDFADLHGSTIDPANPAATSFSDFDRLATATLRLGYALDRSLLYAEGGLAWARGQRSIVGPGFNQFTDHNTNHGLVIGVGWEHQFAPNWSVKLEYNHFFFRTKDEQIVQQPGGAIFLNNDKIKSMDTVLLGLNYRFGSR